MAFATVAEARAHLRITGTGEDSRLDMFVVAADEVLASRVGPTEPTQVTERVCVTGYGMLVLTQTPVVSVTSLTPVLDWMSTVDVDTLTVDTRSGVVQRTDSVPLFGEWDVEYQAGFSVLPMTVKLAGLDLVMHWWRQSQSHASATYGETALTDFSDLPNAVLNKLRPYERIPVG